MGSAGLQVSLDGGTTFIAAAPNSPAIAGSAAISPGFDSGDPSILIGNETLLRYDDSTRLIAPHPVSIVGPLNPAFAPQYPNDDRILIGATSFEPASNTNIISVHTCSGSVCSSAALGSGTRPPRIRPAPAFSSDGTAFAFTREDLFVSTDGAESFDRVDTRWEHSWLLEVVPTRTRVFAALSPYGSEGDAGIYASTAPYTSWTRIADPLFDQGVRSLAATDGHLLAALEDNGVACSSDGGQTWARRCN
jgi:hypothetical protein